MWYLGNYARNPLQGEDFMRYIKATLLGQVYNIPEMWWVGYCRTHTPQEAVVQWAAQELAEREINRQYVAGA